ncbi:LysR substrate-binding domain-containing protein [Roseomonas elaeocarpi]|uniref:LysR substrate-binding domain-containing protein n=1 Tax=Roseomonas elaeocarpi TaxID=907779 RepID=A0ABV6K084_9PROT
MARAAGRPGTGQEPPDEGATAGGAASGESGTRVPVPGGRPQHSLSGLSLRDLEYAVTVAELRHFGRAAERCGVSQPALSEQVRKLEALLGTPLFERGSRGVAPTPAGEALLAQARQVIREARGLLEMAGGRAGVLAGPLRLGVIATLGPYYVPGLLRDVRQRFPALHLRLQEARTVELLDALAAGTLDLALVALPAPAPGLVGEALFFEPFQLACPADDPLLARPLPRLEDLPEQRLLLLEEGHCLREQALSLCRRPAGSGAADGRFATSLEMLRHMIAAGEGYSLLPLLARREGGALDGLVAWRDLESPEVGRTVGLVWRATDPRGPLFRDLTAFLRDHNPEGTRPVQQAG